MADAKVRERKKEKKKKEPEEKKVSEKEPPQDSEPAKAKEEKSKSVNKGPARIQTESGGLHPCVILIGVLMLLAGVYVTWVAVSNNATGEVEGSMDGGRLATSLKTWPRRVLEHHSSGVYVPISDGKQSYNVFALSEGNSRKENEVVLLLHGVPVSSFVYRKMLPFLNEAGIYAVAFDFPGMGLSDKPKDISYDWHYLADRVKDVINSMNLGPVHLVLHDTAGPIGLEFAIKYPALVRSITFGNSIINPEGHEPPFPMSTFKMDYVKHATFWFTSTSWPIVSHVAALSFRLQAASSISHEDYLAHAFLLKYNRGKESFFKIMEGFDTSAKHAEYLKQGLKTLIEEKNISVQAVWVTDDVMTRSEEHKAYLVSNFALKHVHTLSSKHYLQEDQPEEFSRHVINFVKEQTPTPLKVQNKKQREAEEHIHAHREEHGHSTGAGMPNEMLSYIHSAEMGHGHHSHDHAGCSHH